MLAGTALIMDIIADFDAETCAWVCDPPTGRTSLIQEVAAVRASAKNIYLLILFMIFHV
jgi:hypothetical protein